MEDLFNAARDAKRRAYAPYSGFNLGTALRGAGGGVFSGCNVENAAHPEGLCAEAAAITAMIAGGERVITEVLVLADGEQLCSPCGGCRQKLREFGAEAVPVHLCGPEGLRRTLSLGELLPLAFSPDNLQQG